MTDPGERKPPETPWPKRLATEKDLQHFYGPGMLLFGSPVQPQPAAPEAAADNDQSKGS